MSLVIAIKDKDRIVLGADKQSSTGDSKEHTCTKIWEAPDMPGLLLGGVGSLRASQIIQYSQLVDKNLIPETGIDTSFVICSVVPSLVDILNANGVSTEIADDSKCIMIPNAFILAYEDKAWIIWHDLSVSEITDYFAIGSGSDIAKGVLYATEGKDPFSRIVTSIEAAAENTLYVDNGIDLLATEFTAKDEKLLKKALGIVEEK